MDLLSLVLACSPWVAPETTLGIIDVESHGNPFAIHDNTSGRSFLPRTLAEAEVVAVPLIRAGHRLDLGLMQVSQSIWFAPAHVSLKEAFDPCLNIAYGTTILSNAYSRQAAQGLSASTALARALSIYNSGDAFRARAYAAEVARRGTRQVNAR